MLGGRNLTQEEKAAIEIVIQILEKKVFHMGSDEETVLDYLRGLLEGDE